MHDNYRHDHTRRICLIFYQLLPTTSAANEYGQQMRIQILILGLKGLIEPIQAHIHMVLFDF